jgi:hypothetical protein
MLIDDFDNALGGLFERQAQGIRDLLDRPRGQITLAIRSFRLIRLLRQGSVGKLRAGVFASGVSVGTG